MTWVPRVLSQTATLRLQRLDFDVWLFASSQLSSANWDEISWILAHPRYRSVREVTFVHRGYMDIEDVSQALRSRLEALRARGVLFVEDGRPRTR